MTTDLHKHLAKARPDAQPKITFRTDARADAQYALPGEYLLGESQEAQAPPTHYTPLYASYNHDSASDRELRATYDPHAKLWTYDIAWNVFDDWFDFVDASSDEVLDEMDVVQERFRELRLKECLTRACAEERKHGWSVIYKVYSGARIRTPDEQGMTHFMGDAMAFSDTPVTSARDVLAVQALPTMDVQVEQVDQFNQPEIIRYATSSSTVGANVVNVRLHASRCWLLNPRPKDRSWTGDTALAGIWEVLWTLQQHLDSMSYIAQKFGMGLMWITDQGDISDTESSRMNTVIQAAGKRRHVIADMNRWGTPQWIGPEMGDTGLPEQIDILYGMLAAGTGLPKTRWIGAQAGDLEGSRTNLKIEYGVISAIQSTYDPIIRSIVNDLFPGQFRDYKIKWRLEYQMDKLEEAQVLQTQAGAIQGLSTVMSIDEIRKKLGLTGPLNPEETVAAVNQARQLEASKELGRGLAAAGGVKPPGAKPTQPTRADAYDAHEHGQFAQFVQHWEGEGYSRREIVKLCQMSSKTLPEWLRAEQGETHELQL